MQPDTQESNTYLVEIPRTRVDLVYFILKIVIEQELLMFVLRTTISVVQNSLRLL